MPTHSPRGAPPVTLALNLDEFARLCQVHRLSNDRKIAAALGIQHSTAWRTKTGNTGPSERFIAGALRAFPSARFEQLFRIVPYEKKRKKS